MKTKPTDPRRPRMYGRSKGRPLRAGQEALFETLYPEIEFGVKPLPADRPLWLEIGFGGSEHLIWQAEKNPGVHIIGAEPFINGVAKALASIDAAGLDNVSLLEGDGREIMDALPAASLDTLFVLFPDPWPKARHNKRRIINAEFLENAHRILKPGARFRFGSDIIDYVDWTLTRIKHHGGFDWQPGCHSDWRTRPQDWPETRYEAKAKREGRTCHYFEFERI